MARRAVLCFFFLILAFPFKVFGQSDSISHDLSIPVTGEEGSVNETRLAIIGAAVVGVMGTIHVYQSNGWWKDNRRSFHFREDLRYALHVDKLGHFYSGTVLTFLMDKAFRWSNVPENTSLLLGAGVSTLFQTYVEIEDGFSAWGFDRVDFAANVAGAFYPVLQRHVPLFQNFQMKFSYLPSENINRPGAFAGQKHLLMDDYEGQTLWLSLKMKQLLPLPISDYWPDWLCLAVGYGARDILSTDPYRVYFVALDYDMTRIIPQTTGFLRTLGETLNFIHLPAPAVRISPGTVWYGLYF